MHSIISIGILHICLNVVYVFDYFSTATFDFIISGSQFRRLKDGVYVFVCNSTEDLSVSVKAEPTFIHHGGLL